MTVQGEEADITQLGLSLRIQSEFKDSDLSIVPYLKVESKSLLSGGEGVVFTNSFAEGGALPEFENTTNPFDDSSLSITAGIDIFEATSATKTSLLYQMETKENSTNYQIGLQVNMMF